MWASSQIDALYRKTRYAVFLRCRALLSDDAEARDVTQEVYLHLLDRPDEFRGDAAPSTYLYAIATNRSISRLRAKMVRDEGWRDAVAHFCRDAVRVENPETAVSVREMLTSALGEADEETTLLLIYHFVDGLSQGEIASLLGVSRVTVNQRIQRFRDRMQQTTEERP